MEQASNPRTTRIVRHIDAPPAAVYRALLDGRAVQSWKVPDGMRSEVHLFEPHPGGRFRVSLSYEDTSAVGKTSGHTDTYHGHFESLTPDRQVVEVLAFESADAAMARPMRITWDLAPEAGGTRLVGTHEGVPEGVSLDDNREGWTLAVDKLARLVEAGG